MSGKKMLRYSKMSFCKVSKSSHVDVMSEDLFLKRDVQFSSIHNKLKCNDVKEQGTTCPNHAGATAVSNIQPQMERVQGINHPSCEQVKGAMRPYNS